MAMHGDPVTRCARTIEHGEKNQYLFDRRMERDRAVRQCSVVGDGGSKATKEKQDKRGDKSRYRRPRQQDESND